MLVNIRVSLTNKTDAYYDEVIVTYVEDRSAFSYIDNQGNPWRIEVSDQGIVLHKEAEDHLLELSLNGDNYAMITTAEGKGKINVKVLDFVNDSDILVIRYLISDEERKIEIKYY